MSKYNQSYKINPASNRAIQQETMNALIRKKKKKKRKEKVIWLHEIVNRMSEHGKKKYMTDNAYTRTLAQYSDEHGGLSFEK